jgi:type I restriction enzyme S subunit
LPEQGAIVRFLDHADQRIRRYILAKQKLIKLLEEQKQVIIHRAVTRGLDRNVRLKLSGVEWLGDVPEHWKVIRFKFAAAKIVDCLHETPKYSEIGAFPAIRTADISPGRVHLSSARRIEATEYARWVERLEPRPGDILYSREGERFGIAACVPEGTRLCISQRMMVFRIRPEHNPVFIMWLLNNNRVYAQACQDVMGATAPHVNVSTIRNYLMALPNRDEQDSLVSEIEALTGGFSSTITTTARELSLLREYRARLVADVVTGKLDVREAAAALPDESDEPEPLDDTMAADTDEADDDPDRVDVPEEDEA